MSKDKRIGKETPNDSIQLQSLLLDIPLMTCDRLPQVDNYAALKRIGSNADGVYPALREHLENCGQCQTRYRMLQEALRG